MRGRLLILLGVFALPAPATGQTARLGVASENFRASPGGARLATVFEGAAFELGDLRGDWRAATLEGWVWAASLGEDDRDGHDVVVATDGGENLRAAPNGQRIARLLEGMLLDEVERRGGWVRVRRSGWIWVASLEPVGTAARPAARSGVVRTGSGASAAAGGADGAARWRRAGPRGSALLGAPGGDTLAHIGPESAIEIVAREGNWARARVEGWLWLPSLGTPVDSGQVLKDVSAASLAAEPDRFRGRLVEWTVQFIALDRADEIRTDFYDGEPFILTRGPGDEPGFVYIAVPPDQLERVERLAPLERIVVLARVRTASSPLTGAPVLDLMEIRH